MQKPLSNPFRPAASRNLKPSCETDEFAWSAVSETNFHHASPYKLAISKKGNGTGNGMGSGNGNVILYIE